ncbi:MAG: hypothetical protein EXR79_00980 [Myxococcales bacterium]|nr:hypothetical protein [Myxococcales bacterium]
MTRPLFVLLGIPVWVSGWHFLILAMLFMWAFNHGVAFGIAAVLVGSFSTLAHELGHGTVSKLLGLEPEVVLTGFGGFCRHQPAQRPLHEFLIVAAGPAMNFVLAIGFAIAGTQADGLVALVCNVGMQINVIWGLYNLLPIMPLDGGMLLRTGLRKVIRTPLRADRVTYRAGVIVGGLVAAWMLTRGWMFGGIMLGMAALENWRMLKALDVDPARHETDKHARVRELLDQARAAFDTGDYDAAIRFSHQARAEPWLSQSELTHVWHVLAVASARLGEWEDALRYAERLPASADMAAVQAAALMALGDGPRARKFLATPTALLLPETSVAQLRDMARGT